MKVKFELDQLNKTSVELKKNINYNIVLISGEMGAGKTTLIKELLLIMCLVPHFQLLTNIPLLKMRLYIIWIFTGLKI